MIARTCITPPIRLVLGLFVLAGGNLCGPGCANETGTADPFTVAAVLVHKQAFDRPHDVELQGHLALVPGKGGSLAIVDVSCPTRPHLVWHRHDAKRLEDAETVLSTEGRLFLGTHEFHSIDIRHPRKPIFDKALSTTPKIARINGMVRRGNTIFAAGKNGILAVFDVRTPAVPKVTAAVNIRKQYHIGWPHDVDLHQAYAVVPDPRRFGRTKQKGKLSLIQVFEKKTGKLLPARLWKLAGVVATDELVGANRVQVSGKYAFVAASTRGKGGRLVVVDLRKPEAPQQVATMPFARRDGWGPNGLTVAGGVVFLAGGQSVAAMDISQPQKPIVLANQRFADVLKNANPRYSGGGDSGHDLVHRGGYLYVTGQNDHCLMILRVNSKRIRQLVQRKNIQQHEE